ncbi:fungal-specific transcription factor domain-containing protein [Dactylonectria macrodidyma]|uniref:Fungal-specific transcription factor domain-containing protein n=1 Tax=Dactylonectria macrodidyma TaxID=307937 RepID=A0A9P9DK10_9HYPO|nr:fungal-specific transcription factor domain-containing protein [Dactylonectria macrodidyma]
MPGDELHPQQACDNCRYRKIKCDRGSPCKHCIAASLQCQYLHVIRRKGPRRGIGRRLAQLKQGQTELDKNCFEVITLNLPSPSSGKPQPSSINSQSSGSAVRGGPEALQRDNTRLGISPLISTEPEDAVPLPGSLNHSDSLLDTVPPDLVAQNRRLCLSLVAHVEVFLKHMFPIMPVVHGHEILADAARLDQLPPSRYTLIAAICAATRIQLKLDNEENSTGNGPGADIPKEPPLSGEMLLSIAENSLRQFNVIDDYTLDSILSSFFIGTGYGNLNNNRRAGFYLNQSITLAQSLNLTCEAGYLELCERERETRRRVFWLLFVTERTFSLQNRRPVMLRSRIPKPRVIDSDCPTVMHDFLNHIRIFDLLPCALYDWDSQDDEYQSDDVSLPNKINARLSALQVVNSFIESQRFDTLITQQWLRVSMWRLVFGTNPYLAYGRETHLPLGLPIDAGKTVLGELYSVGQLSRDCHGIGMEQKLFDIGISLADTAQLQGQSFSSLEIGPRDLLSTIVKFLTRIRGCESYLLPKLLQHSENILGHVDPTAHISAQWSISDGATDLQDWRVPDDFSVLEDNLTDKISWELQDWDA